MNIKKVDKWIAPTIDGPSLLTMPNIPKPLHSLAPRIIEGQSKWNVMRTQCYMKADYTCQACGKYLGAGKCEAHELYSIDWKQQRSKFERCVCLCHDCHTFIHSGRSFTMYKNGDKYCNNIYLQKIAKKAFELVSSYNNTQPIEEKLWLYGTIIEWLKDPKLGRWLQPMIDHYNLMLYGPKNAYEDKAHWSKWRLQYKDKLYEPKYNDAKEWDKAMRSKNE